MAKITISDLQYLEAVVVEDNSIVGGYAFADAYSSASASGQYFAGTYTSTYTSASSSPYYYYYYGNSAYSSSSSSSAAH